MPGQSPPSPVPPPPQRASLLPLDQVWPDIMNLFQSPSGFCVASVDPDGQPRITPIGSLLLRRDCSGLFIEKFASALPRNIDRDNRICVYAGQDSWASWLLGLLRGHASSPLGVRLYGHAGPRRPLTPDEHATFMNKVRWLRWTRGHAALWGDLTHARDITFHRYDPVLAGKVTRGHWQRRPSSAIDPALLRAIGADLSAHPAVTPLLHGISRLDVHTFRGTATLREFLAAFLSFPPWVRFFFRLHAMFAAILGLRTDDLSGARLHPHALDLTPGKTVAFFKIVAAADDAFWVGGDEEDPHLSVWLAIVAEPTTHGTRRFRVVTMVRYKDWRGPLYMNLILPFHHLIVWALGRRAVQQAGHPLDRACDKRKASSPPDCEQDGRQPTPRCPEAGEPCR